MHLRAVIVTIAPGKSEAYWNWAREIVDLWDAHGVRRAGGPFRAVGPDGGETAIWLTVHENLDEIRDEFRTMYGQGRGLELIEQRPPLVSETQTRIYGSWDATGEAPDWAEVLSGR